MLQKKDYLHVTNHYIDYLDKPPLLFWLGTTFYKIFGVHDWAFRLPSLISTVLGVYSTFKLGKLLYKHETGLNAALLLITCQAYFLMNHDVRTDTILTNLIIFSTWQLTQFLNTNKLIHILGAFTGIGLAMCEKGPIGLVVPVLAVGSYLLVKRDFKSIFKWQWLLGIVVTGIVLIPMCIGLYEQYDLHPDKLVNGKTGVSGLRFFFWEQSFGRITGENVWKDDSGYFFFTHTFLWSFLPWAFLSSIALFFKIVQLFRNKFRDTKNEYLTVGGFVLTFIALSLSRYKLPHYIFVIYPFAAIFTAAWLADIHETKPKLFTFTVKFQKVLCFALLAGLIVINTWFFPVYKLPLVLALSVLFFIVNFFFFRVTENNSPTPLFFSAATAISLNFLLNANFYPQLLKYQSGSEVAFYIKSKNIPAEKCFTFHEGSFALDTYSSNIWKYGWEEMVPDSLNKYGDLWIYTNDEGHNRITKTYPKNISEDKRYDHFFITGLTLPFLNPATRQKELMNRYLIHLTK
jgi:hypothetical protein